MLESIKSSSYRVKMNLREVHKIMQWKDGCVYHTKSLGMIVCKPDYQFLNDKDLMLGSVSTRVTSQLFR